MACQIYCSLPKSYDNMKIKKKLKIKGCFEINFCKKNDARGYFQRIVDFSKIFKNKKKYYVSQISVSFNKKKGTFRGFHFQKKPFEENKFVFCVTGSIIDIVIDLRKNSPTYMTKITKKVSAKKNNTVFIPAGCAHGFITTQKNTKIIYIMDKPYSSKYSSGFNYKSKLCGNIKNIKNISKKDNYLEIIK